MWAETWPRWLLAALAAALVALGLWATGGIASARAERRDDFWQSDLRAISGLLRCAAEAGTALPASLAELDQDALGFCQGGRRLGDPFTGDPYVYERLGERRFRICAVFERPDLLADLASDGEAFDAEEGCIEATITSPTGTGVMQ